MSETTIPVDYDERDLLGSFKDHYGLTYNEAIVELLDAWPHTDWREDSDASSTLAMMEHRLTELESEVDAHDETIEDLREGFLELHERLPADADESKEKESGGLPDDLTTGHAENGSGSGSGSGSGVTPE